MSPCQEFEGCRIYSGYGQKRFAGKVMSAHRVAWMLFYGEDPGKMHVMHKCDNPGCINPEHLTLGTHAENMDDKARKGRGDLKITAESVARIRKLRQDGLKVADIASEFGISPSTVCKLANGKRRKYNV